MVYMLCKEMCVYIHSVLCGLPLHDVWVSEYNFGSGRARGMHSTVHMCGSTITVSSGQEMASDGEEKESQVEKETRKT